MTNTQKNKKKYDTKNYDTKNYDLVIIGGGIAGLYTLYKLSKQFTNLKILLLESGERYGGRIYSYKETIDSEEYVMDLGAGRLGHHHKLINTLISELGLKSKIVNIPNTKTYIEVTENNKAHEKTQYKDSIMAKLYKFFLSPLVSKLGKSALQKFYLYELLTKYMSASFSQKVASVFEYSSDLNELNAYDAIGYFKYDYNKESTFFILNGGLGQIIDHLLLAIKQTQGYKRNNITIINLSHVENVVYNANANLFNISVSNYKNSTKTTYYCDHLICAIPKQSLESLTIFKPLLRDLDSINPINLVRIFEVYKTENGESWFKNIKKTITNSKVQFVIPINSNNGLIMSSYSDCANARFWNNLLAKKGLDYVKQTLNNTLNLVFSVYNISVPSSKYIKLYFWDAGVANWKKNVDSDYLSYKLINPLPNVYIIGENYSKYQAWCEGALMTSENCIAKLIPILEHTKTKTKTKTLKHTRKLGTNKLDTNKIDANKIGGINKKKAFTLAEIKKHNKKGDAWTLIENKVYNISSWIPKHPGGEIIMQAVGKDATQLFNSRGHPSYVKKTILPKYYIGALKK
jgi:cytochrome b involved in lipid metabolism/monoamine oxidase|uniref:Cytochrome b5 heme-binding domain-containing protein n=1 Tax=viral metagenome TaxID=1070528 RepID=A0A6C0CBE6_9ZZZZ